MLSSAFGGNHENQGQADLFEDELGYLRVPEPPRHFSACCAAPSQPTTTTRGDKRTRQRCDNAEAAKRSRQRKKDYLETLEMQVATLKEENKTLKRQLKQYQQKEKLGIAGVQEGSIEHLKQNVQALHSKLFSETA